MNIHTKWVKKFLENTPKSVFCSKYRDKLENYLNIDTTTETAVFSYLENGILRKTETTIRVTESPPLLHCNCGMTKQPCKHLMILIWLKILEWNCSYRRFCKDFNIPCTVDYSEELPQKIPGKPFPSQAIGRLFPDSLGGMRFSWRQVWLRQQEWPEIDFERNVIKLKNRMGTPKQDGFVVRALVYGKELPQYLFDAILRNLSPWLSEEVYRTFQLPGGQWLLKSPPAINHVISEQTGLELVNGTVLSKNAMAGTLQLYGFDVGKAFLPKLITIVDGQQTAKASFSELGLIDCEWRVLLGPQQLTLEEFKAHLENTKWLAEFKETQKVLKAAKKPPKSISKFELIRASLLDEPLFVGKQMVEQFKEMLKYEKVETPPLIQARLWRHQVEGFNWIVSRLVKGFHPLLADEMGLGKTLQTIVSLAALPERKPGTQSLIICPASVVYNWTNEFRKFAPHIVASEWRQKWPTDAEVVVASYGICQSRAKELTKKKIHLMCMDEAQKIKNHRTKTRNAIIKIKARYKLALTGTPIENRVHDMWSIFDLLMPGYLGTKGQFNKKFGKDPELLAKAIKPFLLRRKKDSLEEPLPEKIINTVEVHLAPEQVALYQNVVQQAMKNVKQTKKITRKGQIFRMITHLKQLCNHPLNYSDTLEKMPSRKTERLMGLMEDSDEKTLIFTQFTKTAQLLVEKLGGSEKCAYLHGGMSQKDRQKEIDRFTTDENLTAFVLSTRAAGLGINLNIASRVIMYDLWWNPAVEDQAIDRAHRIGQDKVVNVYRMICKGTFEEKIDNIIQAKRNVSNSCLSNLGNIKVTEMTDDDLSELFEWQT